MENIERHYRELGKNIHFAVFDGTKEIIFTDLSGTVSTMIALAPMLFVGGYPQTVFDPLVGTLTLLLALVASYIISVTDVPLLLLYFLSIKNPILLKVEDGFHSVTSRINDIIKSMFTYIVKTGIRFKSVALLYEMVLITLFVISVKIVMTVVGQELMPPMDTGAVKIKITTESNLPIG